MTNLQAVVLVVVAIIGAAGAIAAARVNASRLGKPNGNGNVIEMLTKILHHAGRTDERLDGLEGKVDGLVDRVDSMEHQLP